MQERNYKTVLYFIAGVILITLAMQAYWNYKNYIVGKQQLVNEVQTSLDNAVETYYADLATQNIIGFTLKDDALKTDSKTLDSIFSYFERLDTLSYDKDQNVHINVDITDTAQTRFKIFAQDGTKNQDTLFRTITTSDSVKSRLAKLNTKNATSLNNPLAKLTSRIIYGLTEEMVDIKKLDTLLNKELERKNINVLHQLELNYTPSTKSNKNIRVPNVLKTDQEVLTTYSNADVLPKDTEIFVNFSNVRGTILKRNGIGLLLSFLFSAAIILSLLYLLRVIKNQKQLAEVKNDLISNITHEFKTPLATIGAAMEGIQLFNPDNDVEKTQRYAAVSSKQVSKLNTMVEKLLETATLDSERLKLNKEEIDLVQLLETITTKEAVLASKKEVVFNTQSPILSYSVDAFHFENALNNLIDNAIKYGGSTIEVSIKQNHSAIEIVVSDTGTELTTIQSKQIFEKFYRVPKGNTHDIKGFGIGLYYTKAIIEKHNGSIAVSVKPTTFKIVLPL